MRKISTVGVKESVISKGSKLTIGLDQGDLVVLLRFK